MSILEHAFTKQDAEYLQKSKHLLDRVKELEEKRNESMSMPPINREKIKASYA
jgi:hypothetical protein